MEDPDPISMDQYHVPRHAQGPKGFDEIPPGAPPGHIFVFGQISGFMENIFKWLPFPLYETQANDSWICFGLDIVVSYDDIKKRNFEKFLKKIFLRP